MSNAAARHFLGRAPPTLPPALRWAFVAGISLFALYGALLVVFYAIDRPLFQDALRFHLLTFVGGREPAMLAVYQADPHAMPYLWMAILAPIMDLSHLLVILTAVWYLFAVMARVPGPDRFLAGLEKAALGQRKVMRRWGLLGLAVFYWLPGFGTGAAAISAIGVMARIPLTRLILVLAASAALVSLFWATSLRFVSARLPEEGWWSHLPIIVIGIAVTLAVVSAIRSWRTSHLLLLPWPVPDHLWDKRLEDFGLRRQGDCLEVDSRILAAAAEIPAKRSRRIRTLAELLLMPGMNLELARRLEARGVMGIESLAQLAPAQLLGAVEDADAEGAFDGRTLVPRWQAEARDLERAAGEAWTGPSAAPS